MHTMNNQPTTYLGHRVYGSPEIRCDHCHGTGIDFNKTEELYKQGTIDRRTQIRCWNCVGNGIDPAKTFRWSGQR